MQGRAALVALVIQTVEFPAGFNTISAVAEIVPGTCAGLYALPPAAIAAW
jgi:hypothetical protein